MSELRAGYAGGVTGDELAGWARDAARRPAVLVREGPTGRPRHIRGLVLEPDLEHPGQTRLVIEVEGDKLNGT
jgi:hypothetical protein